MLGAIAGDIIGSAYERHNIRITDFDLFSKRSLFTDDTVLTLAVADAILSGSDYTGKLREWYRLYPERGYGPGFRKWAASDTIRPGYRFDCTCSGSVPEAIIAFPDSTGFEHAVRLAVSLGGDSDTIACIAGGIAEAYYGGVPEDIRKKVLSMLDDRMKRVVDGFEERYGKSGRQLIQ